MKTVLLLIDMQNDYFENGIYELENSKAAVERASEVLNYFRTNNYPVIHIQHISIKPNATFFKPETQGVKIHDLVTPINNEIIITKHFPNSFKNTNLKEKLELLKIEHIVVMGMMSQHCIDTTVRAAHTLDYNITLLHDTCAARDLSFDNKTINAQTVHNVFMSALSNGFARVISSDIFLKELDL